MVGVRAVESLARWVGRVVAFVLVAGLAGGWGQSAFMGASPAPPQPAELCEKARAAFAAQVAAAPGRKERARQSAQQTLRGLFAGLGFSQVDFVRELPPAQARN